MEHMLYLCAIFEYTHKKVNNVSKIQITYTKTTDYRLIAKQYKLIDVIKYNIYKLSRIPKLVLVGSLGSMYTYSINLCVYMYIYEKNLY